MSISLQVLFLFIIAMPIASVAWTVTHEEVFREFMTYAWRRAGHAGGCTNESSSTFLTCEYCFSHYVTALFLVSLDSSCYCPDWRGYVIAGFSLVGIANVYLGLFARLQLDVKRERVEITAEETMSQGKQGNGKPMQFPATQRQIRGATKGQV